jgi:hypothetical protein
MVHLPEERVALWPWQDDSYGKDDLHFWVEEPGTQEFLHAALMTAACSFAVSACAVAACSATQQAEAEDFQRLQSQEACQEDHEESAQCSAMAAAPIPEKKTTLSRWADIEDSDSDHTPSSSEHKPCQEEFGSIQEVQCSEAHGAARKNLGDGESQVEMQSLPSVNTFFGSRSEPIENGKAFRPRWGDLDDSESEDQVVVDSHFAKPKLLENESLKIQGECDDGDKAQATDAAEAAEVAGQRRSKGSATRGKRGGVKRNAGRHAARSTASWDAASQRPNKSWDASSSWEQGGWASSSFQQASEQTSWQQNGSEVDSAHWGQHEWVHRPRKWQCQFFIGIEEEPTFRVVRRLLGPGGKNVKVIADETGAKLRLRGVGSKFLEGPHKLESTDPLMLCVSASTESGYNTAAHMLQEILLRIYTEYQEFQSNNGLYFAPLDIQMHVGAREYF